jgi:hypothetical protein
VKHCLAWLLCLGAALAQRSAVGEPISVFGLKEELQNGTVQTARVENTRLNLETSFGQLEVQGYPKWLESQPLSGSQLLALARLLPDGLETRLEFSRNKTPFLLIGSRSSPLGTVIGAWRWSGFTAQSAQLTLTPKTQTIPLGQAVVVKQGLLLWCMRLAAIHLPTPETPGLSNEAERPRFDWAAWRVSKTEQCR